MRDLIKSIVVAHEVDVVTFELNYFGKSKGKKKAPFDKVFLDKTVKAVLNNKDQWSEQNTIVLTVKKYNEAKKQQINALKRDVATAKAAWEAAKVAAAAAIAAAKLPWDAAEEALYAAATPAQKDGRRKTKRNSAK